LIRSGSGKLSLRREIQKWLIGLLNDPITKILIKNSHLTKTQLETFLIDILSENIAEKKIIYEEKAKLRLLKGGVSRGAFNRTLNQARKNIIRAIYTVILLGYLGIFETPRLDPYIEIANKLHTYTETYKTILEEDFKGRENLRIMEILQKELEEGLKNLSKPRGLSGRA